jgi:3-isopropylmalate/(R)-2-methylmalate dehydratase large subunit
VLRGTLEAGVCAKDVALHLLAMEYFKLGGGVGRVIEFTGDGVAPLPLDERATLANMAVEAGCVSGIVAADETVVRALASRGVAPDDARRMIVTSDPGARYAATVEVDLGAVVPMVAMPGDPRNGVPVAGLRAPVPIDIAYGGSCTGGKRADMDMYAEVARVALDRGLRVHPRVRFFVQFGSQAVRRYAEERGYLDLFDRVGAQVLDPACGACIRAGPGASRAPSEVTVSAQSRNFPGRSGPGKVYLASPLVVAASAIAGRIVASVGR